MRICVLVHYYVPYRRAGSETMLHALLRALCERGHAVTVYATDMPEAVREYTAGGVRVLCMPAYPALTHAADSRPDVVISHHHRVREASRAAGDAHAPLVVLAHNDLPGSMETIQTARPARVVFNSEWMAAAHGRRFREVEVIRPPVFASEHATTPGDHVTLVNLNDDKGGRILQKLATRMPHVPFLGVTGGHGFQCIPDAPPANLTITPHTTDMRWVWQRTGILLMPSAYESYGMVGVEAMHSGIPVIAAPTPGLQESLGNAGWFVDREFTGGWVHLIATLMEPDTWRRASERARKRAAELDPQPELDRWVSLIEHL